MLLQELKKHKVRDVVRVCEPTYKVEELKTEGITVTDLAYDDGTSPPAEVCWFILKIFFFKPNLSGLVLFSLPSMKNVFVNFSSIDCYCFRWNLYLKEMSFNFWRRGKIVINFISSLCGFARPIYELPMIKTKFIMNDTILREIKFFHHHWKALISLLLLCLMY